MPAAGSATYQIWFRLLIPNPNLNPNSKTDPNPNLNPKSNNNVCSTKRHRNKVQHSAICKSYFRWAGGGYTKGLRVRRSVRLPVLLPRLKSNFFAG